MVVLELRASIGSHRARAAKVLAGPERSGGMKIISHRGYWRDLAEKNTEEAFRRSFGLGFGTQTDVRDCAGELVISQDPPQGGEMRLADFLALHGSSPLPLAINVRAAGLAPALSRAMAGVPCWFAFDCCVPDLREHLHARNPVLTRMSEIEPVPALLHRCAGLWLDAFGEDWIGAPLVEEMLVVGKWVFVVSPELHQRDPGPCWAILEAFRSREKLILCTAQPERARAHFGTEP